MGGFGIASIWCLAALPFTTDINDVLLDAISFDMRDEDCIEKFYVPGFMAAGGFESCLRLCSHINFTLLNGIGSKIATFL